MSETETRYRESKTITEATPISTPEPSKLIVDLTNLSEGSMRTVKRELKVIIEDYGWQKMISSSIRVTEGE